MLELQVETLETELVEADRLRKAACKRADSAERRNRNLKAKLTEADEILEMVAQCWGCTELGNRTACNGCTNREAFEKIESRRCNG